MRKKDFAASRFLPPRPSSCPPSSEQSFVPPFVKPGCVKPFNNVNTNAEKIDGLLIENIPQQLVMINI
jgi:hypothetical protein